MLFNIVIDLFLYCQTILPRIISTLCTFTSSLIFWGQLWLFMHDCSDPVTARNISFIYLLLFYRSLSSLFSFILSILVPLSLLSLSFLGSHSFHFLYLSLFLHLYFALFLSLSFYIACSYFISLSWINVHTWWAGTFIKSRTNSLEFNSRF